MNHLAIQIQHQQLLIFSVLHITHLYSQAYVKLTLHQLILTALREFSTITFNVFNKKDIPKVTD